MPKAPRNASAVAAIAAVAAILAAPPAGAADRAAVVATYADIAAAGYADSLAAAERLKAAVEALVADPSAGTLAAARAAWIAARVPYQQTEAFRFANPIVDGWEGKVNAWPLDEGLIDYTADSYAGPTDENPFASLNVIATPRFTLGSVEVDATEITPGLISETLQEADGIETNVAAGYHAIEFLLWGQDLHGTGPGAGERPWTDYAAGADCTGGNCDRRGAYLAAAAGLLVADLAWMVEQWQPDGAARAGLAADPDAAITAMLVGLGSLSYGELAGERMKLGLLLHDPEEEHDCFSDNTYNSHFNDAVGIRNVWTGSYARTDGSTVSGPSLREVVAARDPALADEVTALVDRTLAQMEVLKAAGEAGTAYDQLIALGNDAGNAEVQAAIDALVAQAKGFERAMSALGLSGTFEGSDSLDNPGAVFK